MNRAIELAKNAIRSAYPNPAVGCVIVSKNSIIGEGFTSPYGGPHAEVNAIKSVQDPKLLKNATLYVTLEPCSHFGKTPPCADLIIAHKIPIVFIGLKDPNPKVAGSGIAALKKQGVSVHQGILEEKCKDHHKKFLCFQIKKRPYVILKWAETKDGFIAPHKTKRASTAEPYWISSEASKTRVHLWRSKEQGILIGVNTLLEDNPSLDVRRVSGMNPTPIVIDPHLQINKSYNLYRNKDLILVVDHQLEYKASDYPFSIVSIDFSKNSIAQLLKKLHQLSIMSIFVEGGAFTINSFLTAGLWDEARVIRSRNNFEDGLTAPVIPFKATTVEQLTTDQISYYLNNGTN